MMGQPLVLSQSLEDYLKAILRIVSEKEAVRATEIARRMGVGRSSVTGALRALAERNLINYAPYDVITLTADGRRVAEDVLRRHSALRRFLIDVLAVDPDLADRAACQMEHVVPPEVMERLAQFAQYMHECPEAVAQWDPQAGYFCAHAIPGTCVQCTVRRSPSSEFRCSAP